MQLLLDSVTATLLIGALILMMAAISLRQSEESGDISSRRAIAGRTASLEMHVASDFQNVLSVQAMTDSSITLALVDDPETMTTATVTYARSRRVADADTVFDVTRTEGTDVALVGPGLASWTVSAGDSTGTATTSAALARQLTVRFATTPAFPRSDDTLDVVWQRTFSPSLLSDFQF